MAKIVIVPLKDCLSDNIKHTQSIFDEIRELEQKEVKVYIFGHFSATEISKIKERYPLLPGTQYFTTHLFGAKNILTDLLNFINVQEKNLYAHDIALFTQPPVPEPTSLLKQLYHAFMLLLELCLGRRETIPAVVQDTQQPYKRVIFPDLNQRSLFDVLEKDLKWEFNPPKVVEPKVVELKAKVPNDTNKSKKSKRKIKDPTFKPSESDSADEGYASEIDRKPAITPLKTVKSKSDATNGVKNKKSEQPSPRTFAKPS